MKFAVMGSPIAHSLSPKIHKLYAEQLGHVTWDYDRIEVATGSLASALAAFAADGGTGVNITAPLKFEAFLLCGPRVSELAQRSGAVNTLSFDAATGEWSGDLTDGVGLVRALTGHFGQDLRERRTLLLGAGGAAHAVLPSLLDAGIGEVIIVNRDPAKADALADRIGEPGRVNTRRLDQLTDAGGFDFIVNTISDDPVKAFGLSGEQLTARPLIVDLNYGERASALKAFATVHNAPLFVDGLGMLIEQAAESFAIWNGGNRPDTEPVYSLLADKY